MLFLFRTRSYEITFMITTYTYLTLILTTCAYPSTAYYHGFNGTVALLSQSLISLYGITAFDLNQYRIVKFTGRTAFHVPLFLA